MADTRMTGELAILEARIEANLPAFVQVGKDLAEIKDRALYQGQYASFEEYLETRWSWTKATGYRYIEAARVAATISDTSLIPTVDHAHLLAPLSVEERQEMAPQIARVTVRKAKEIVRAKHPAKPRTKNVTPAESDGLPPDMRYLLGGPVPDNAWRHLVHADPQKIAADMLGDPVSDTAKMRKVMAILATSLDLVARASRPSSTATTAGHAALPDDDGMPSFGFSRPAPKGVEKPASKSRFGR